MSPIDSYRQMLERMREAGSSNSEQQQVMASHEAKLRVPRMASSKRHGLLTPEQRRVAQSQRQALRKSQRQREKNERQAERRRELEEQKALREEEREEEKARNAQEQRQRRAHAHAQKLAQKPARERERLSYCILTGTLHPEYDF
ncbi:PREDICTED: putative uncharacterized protein DDB_G0271982 [Priapulus caudatus]|uniref:Uncharacterized protein n=1 Tax=Priapulus caudatus TaxID=37621 RepID=A0ABM1EU41_PRICU|nr:PREDICTED: putative uncharacterized protein DDB_G0271982 [Priapulus caudatus]